MTKIFILISIYLGYSSAVLACDAFEPKGKLIRTQASDWFTDTEGKEFNLAVVFRSYDEDGDDLAEFETVTRVFRDKGPEPHPFLYYRGKDTLYPNENGGTGYAFKREKEYIDINATGKCEDIILNPNFGQAF
jgi:hypothetical protein